MAVPIYNQKTTADVPLRLMQTLDDFFASVRLAVDAADPQSAVQLLNDIRSTMYGIVPTQFTRGVVFGCGLCRLDEVPLTWGLGEGPGVPPGVQVGQPFWGAADDPCDIVVTRGNLFDGTKIINLEPPEGLSYVYKLRLPYNLSVSDCYAFGSVFYRTDTHTVQTLLLGQTNPYDQPVLLDREAIAFDQLFDLSLSPAETSGVYHVTPPADAVLLGRVLVDINAVTDGLGSYTVHVRPERQMYPFSAGQPLTNFLQFGTNLGGALAGAEKEGYDVALIYPLLDQIVRAALWGAGGFRTYWMARGDLPVNVKYYYDQIYTPPIP